MKSVLLGLLAFALIVGSGVALSDPITYDYTVTADPLAANADPLSWFVEASLTSGGSLSGTFLWPNSSGASAGYSNVDICIVSSVVGDSCFSQLEEGAGPRDILATNSGGELLFTWSGVSRSRTWVVHSG